MKKHLLAGVAAAAVVLMASGSVSAAPKPNPGFNLTFSSCTDSTLNGSITGFLPPSVFIPVSFGPYTGTYTTPDGTFPDNHPASTQNDGKGGNKPPVTCDYAVSGDFGGYSFQGTGGVTFFVVGQP